MSDSLSTYDLSFFSVPLGDDMPKCFPMKIYFTSPSGREYTETVFYDASGDELKVQYRIGLKPVEWGVWEMDVKTQVEGLDGLGLICSKKK